MKKLTLIFIFTLVGLAFMAFRTTADFSIGIGEKLVYKVYYNWNFVWVPAGEMSFEVKDEKDSYHIDVTGRTYSSYEWFYRVRDKYHSYIDKKTGLPKLYIRDIQQGTYRHYEKIIFDYSNNKAYSYTGRTISDLKLKVLDLEKNYYDLVSCMYFLRNLDLEHFQKAKKASFNLLLDDDKYELGLEFLSKKKSHAVKDCGDFKALNLSAEVVKGNVFSENAKLHVWIAEDLNRIPVQIESPLVVGSVKAILKTYTNLKHPFEAKID